MKMQEIMPSYSGRIMNCSINNHNKRVPNLLIEELRTSNNRKIRMVQCQKFDKILI